MDEAREWPGRAIFPVGGSLVLEMQ